ncbi:uncharacterized protein LOC105842955 [Bombyx mori]|uniref:Cuticle protein n=1 Tax=Bombyx mori TaxID=7091 RepID=A0A8R2R4G9_BOMMO|nr:leucine-rich repeat extensin-like protein 5 isoform X1 [Bombyx mori]
MEFLWRQTFFCICINVIISDVLVNGQSSPAGASFAPPISVLSGAGLPPSFTPQQIQSKEYAKPVSDLLNTVLRGTASNGVCPEYMPFRLIPSGLQKQKESVGPLHQPNNPFYLNDQYFLPQDERVQFNHVPPSNSIQPYPIASSSVVVPSPSIAPLTTYTTPLLPQYPIASQHQETPTTMSYPPGTYFNPSDNHFVDSYTGYTMPLNLLNFSIPEKSSDLFYLPKLYLKPLEYVSPPLYSEPCFQPPSGLQNDPNYIYNTGNFQLDPPKVPETVPYEYYQQSYPLPINNFSPDPFPEYYNLAPQTYIQYEKSFEEHYPNYKLTSLPPVIPLQQFNTKCLPTSTVCSSNTPYLTPYENLPPSPIHLQITLPPSPAPVIAILGPSPTYPESPPKSFHPPNGYFGMPYPIIIDSKEPGWKDWFRAIIVYILLSRN